MPFTPAHPAIVLPFINKKYFSATALIIGSISPDFEYFFKASVSGVHGHTIWGLFYFDLPVTILFAFVFHQLVKENLIGNLPVYLQRKFSHTHQFNFKKYFSEHYLVFIYSALIGAGSHIFWDGFTHNGSFFVNYFQVYRNVTVPFQGVDYPLFYALQNTSTFVGLAIIMTYVFLMPMDKASKPKKPSIAYWFVLVILGSIFFTTRFLLYPGDYDLGNAVVTGISSLILSLCVLGFVKSLKPIQQKA
jgi:Domain of unknown function (DUF4184)